MSKFIDTEVLLLAQGMITKNVVWNKIRLNIDQIQMTRCPMANEFIGVTDLTLAVVFLTGVPYVIKTPYLELCRIIDHQATLRLTQSNPLT